MTLRLNGSTSGYTEIDAPAVAGNNTLILPSGGELVAATNGNINIASINSGPLAGSRNRVINGDMRIDQRNNGAAVSFTATGPWVVDRWLVDTTGNASFTGQRNAGSVTPPTGFTNYLGYTSTAAYTPGANTTCCPRQAIEGFNCADFAWGTANAQTVTLSFWVRSSLSGTHSGSLSNEAGNRSYVFSYSITAANTWEYKTLVIPGDTSGTWNTSNGYGIGVRFNLGTGTGTYGTTSTGWQAGNFVGLTSAVQVSATNGATFYLTGVQLEPGSTASPFERRSFGQELALCQRYFASLDRNSNNLAGPWGSWYSTTACRVWRQLPVPMRTTPTINCTGLTFHRVGYGDSTVTQVTNVVLSPEIVTFDGISASPAAGTYQPATYLGRTDASAEL